MSSTSVSVVIPCAPGLTPSLGELERFLESTGLTFEVLVAECDGYGTALRRGVSDAKGSVIIIADPELPYPVRAIGDAVAMVESGTTDVVFASSRADYRGPALLRWLLVPLLPDPSIRLAAFSNTAAKIVAGESKLARSGCELELAFLANKYGFRVEYLVVDTTRKRARELGAIAALKIRMVHRRHA